MKQVQLFIIIAISIIQGCIPLKSAYSVEDFQCYPDVIYLFRHAEKQKIKGEKNPELTKDGFYRAEALADSLRLIQNGSIKRTASIMKTSDGKVWAGPVHYHEGRYMVGAFHSSRSHATLKEETVPNVVVSDYRLLEAAEAAELQLFPNNPEQRQAKRKSGKRDKTAGGNKVFKKEANQ